MTIEQKLKLWYPADVLQPATPYIYFNSLERTETGRYIYNTVKPYYSKSLGEASISGAQSKISSALNFLKQVISAESQKEVAFIQFLTTKIKENKLNLAVPSQEEDWSNFIQEIQTALGTNQEFGIKSLLNELSRLKTNNAILKKADKEAYFTHSLDDQVSSISEYLKKVEATMIAGKQTNEVSRQIYDIVLTKFGTDLFELDNNNTVKLSRGQLASLLLAINALALKNYTIETYTGKTKFNAEEFEKVISNKDFEQQIRQYISDAKKLPWITEDLMRIFEINTEQFANDRITAKEQKNILNNTSLFNQAENHLDKLNQAVMNAFRRKNLLDENAIKVTAKSNVLAEVLSALNFGSKSGTFYIKNTGISGAKPDNVIALLTIDTSSLDPENNPQHKQIIELIGELRKIMNELTNNLKNTNTTQYYQNQQLQWKQAEAQMQDILNKISSLYDTVVDCYMIEDSTKNYAYLNSKTKGIVNESFHGGSLGARLGDQLAKIEALGATGGFSMADKAWLTNAIINSGPGMIANNNKNAIEQYLSTFAVILLFDDQVNIANEAIYQMAETTGSSVKKIHLFSLNNGYYPLSYVLYLTYSALSKGYEDVLNTVQSGSGAKVNIVNYVTESRQAYLGWQNTVDTALNSTKIELQFMTYFMGILERLFPTIG